MTQSLKTLGLLLLAGILAVFAMVIYNAAPRLHLQQAQNAAPSQPITSFDECAAAGYPVMESYPRQCISGDGRHFVEILPPAQDPYVDPMPQNPVDDLGLQANGCAVAGCSGQLCVSADEAGDIVTTCEYRAEYACYREASCEKQANGQCGWSETPQLTQCLANPPSLETLELEVR